MSRRKPPETPLPLQDLPEYLVPATWDHYALWLEGHLLSGGEHGVFVGPEDLARYYNFYDPKRFIQGMAFVTGDCDEDAGVKSEYERVIVPDHIIDIPPAATRYMMATDRVEGFPNVPIYPMPRFREFAPLFAEIFAASLAPTLIDDANPEREGGTWYWPEKRDATLRKYRYLAEYFYFELSEDFIQDALSRAVDFRRRKKQEMATPEYQRRQQELTKVIIESTMEAFQSLFAD